jgi:hypothetical protein
MKTQKQRCITGIRGRLVPFILNFDVELSKRDRGGRGVFRSFQLWGNKGQTIVFSESYIAIVEGLRGNMPLYANPFTLLPTVAPLFQVPEKISPK